MAINDKTLEDKLTKVRHQLHQHPELSNQEHQTTLFLNSYLETLGYHIVTPQKLLTGVIAEIGPSESNVIIGLRSDIDALPIAEKTGLNYASVNEGIMHACGHDFHMASLLGAAELLADQANKLTGRVRLIFQPAEEIHVGAQAVAEAGGIKNLNAIIGFHNKPDLKVNEIGILSGGLMAAVDQFKVTFRGQGTHAAMPQLGNDPIVALTNTVNTLQTVVSRKTDPQSPVVVSVTHIDGGSTWNVLPDVAWFEGTVRSFDQASRQLAREQFYQIVNGQAATSGLAVDISWIEGPNVVNNDSELTPIVIEETKQHAKLLTPKPSNAGEDFSYFSQKVPSVFAFIGSAGTTDWHHDDLIIDDRGLLTAARWYFYTANRLLAHFSGTTTNDR